MFEIFFTNSLNNLAAKLAETISSNPLPPLENEIFIIQSEGMAYWLRLKLARILGCASGFSLLFPGNFCRNLSSGKDYPKEVVWEIFSVLNDEDFTKEYPILAAFLADRDERKLIQLSRRIEALFSEYTIYRHQMLCEWETGTIPADEQERWQAELWRRLEGVMPRATEFQQLLDNPQSADLPKRISVFGVSTLPPLFLRFLHIISERTEVQLYLPTPTEHFWADIRSEKEQLSLFDRETYSQGHPLLSSLAVQGREFFDEISRLDEQGQYLTPLEFNDPGYGSILHTLQSHILEMKEPQSINRSENIIAGNDRSIAIHCCHSPLREVEVLHQQILEILDRDSELSPSDILVVMSDLEKYTPWVRAVFGSCDILGRHYRLSERSRAEADSKSQAFIDLLRLPRGRQEAQEVLTLLDYETIRGNAGIELSELEPLRELVSALNIRWGIGAEERKKLNGIDIGKQNSWRAGLDRLLLAYATGNLDSAINDILPYKPEIDFDLAGRFSVWVRKIFDWCSVLSSRARPVSEWKTVLNRLASDVMGLSGSDEDKESWIKLNNTEADPEVTLAAIIEFVSASLQESTGRGAFLGGGISFCALQPMRAVPFKVVAMLGMDYNSFPRRPRHEGYNLIYKKSKPGDRNPRNDDRQLFLETIVNAEEKLIITYSGLSSKDLSVTPPSVCVCELTDCIDKTFSTKDAMLPSRKITVVHPLQPFSAEYFNNSSDKLFSYDRYYIRKAEDDAQVKNFISEPITEAKTPEEISLDDFIRFWQNPQRWFCNNTLNIYFPREAEELNAEEAQLEGALEEYTVNNTLLTYALSGETGNGAKRLIHEGLIPPLELGKAKLCQTISEVESFREKIGKINFLKPASINIRCKGITINATIDKLTENGVVLYRMATVKPKDLIQGWLCHLAVCTTNKFTITRIFAKDKTITINPVDNAQEILEEITACFKQGQRQPLPFFTIASHVYAQTISKINSGSPADKNDPAEKALAAWRGNDYVIGDIDDEYTALCFKDIDTLCTDDFKILAEKFWSGFLTHMEDNK